MEVVPYSNHGSFSANPRWTVGMSDEEIRLKMLQCTKDNGSPNTSDLSISSSDEEDSSALLKEV